MIQEIILHIGMHKTGTTSIQCSLREFDNGSIRYARLSDHNHSIPVYSLFSKERYNYHIHVNQGRSTDFIDNFNRKAKSDLDEETSLDRQKLILSGEDISTIDTEGVQALVSYLKSRAKCLRVIAYVRDPSGFASSAIQQYIVGGMRKTFIPTPDYKNRFKAFTECAEIDSLEFIKFGKNELEGGSVVQDFCKRIGLEADGIQEDRNNESTSLECAQLIYHFNRFGTPTSGSALLARSRELFIYKLRQYFVGDRFKIPEDMVWSNIDVEDVLWMEQASSIKLVPDNLSTLTNGQADQSEAIEHTMNKIEHKTLQSLQELVATIEPQVGRDTNITNLLNFLFASIYFEQRSKKNA